MVASAAPKPFNQRKRLIVVQTLSVLIVIALLFAQPGWDENSTIHEFIEMAGLALILACVFGRLWSILFVGSRKNKELVTDGPYSITRNPLYLFSTIGAVGIGLTFGSLIVAALLGTLIYAVFHMTARKEEAFLRGQFGAEYDAYAARTPLFWPNFRAYRDAGETTFSPKAVVKTFFDALYFLAAFPAIELVEYLHETGVLPTLFHVF
ncbi:MAG: isoprenylcysteine carboxylmethyltransferase family protein [Hyphomicrobiales bacterium]|nr:MAG: isoprenylcysteine carboxylmethyltransferase family protein [Hyphomicrobiales bacterium]